MTLLFLAIGQCHSLRRDTLEEERVWGGNRGCALAMLRVGCPIDILMEMPNKQRILSGKIR